MNLFRAEVTQREREPLYGEISIAVPLAWCSVTWALSGLVVVGFLFFAKASFTRIEVASGSVMPEAGILKIVSSRSGVVEQIFVKEGDRVKKGAKLALIRSEHIDASGLGTQAAILDAISIQRERIRDQQGLTRMAANAEQRAIDAQVDGLRQQIETIKYQALVQSRLVKLAEEDLAQISKIAERGFISRKDLMSRQEILLSRQRELSTIHQIHAEKAGALEQMERTRVEAESNARATSAALATSMSQMERERATTRGEQANVIIAPIDGTVADISINIGDPLVSADTALWIVPGGKQLIAKLLISGRSAGLVRKGQSVALNVEAYPSERYGTVKANISRISSLPTVQMQVGNASVSSYIAIATIPNPAININRKRVPLKPGMAVTGRISIERRTLLHWVFDPIFRSVNGR